MNLKQFWVRRVLGLAAIILLSSLSLLSWIWAATVAEVTSGAPANMGTKLPPESYVEFQAHRLAHAKIVWLNYDLLRSMGVEVPPQGLTQEFAREVLDSLGFMVPEGGEPAGTFTDTVKTIYADRYGGYGIGTNFGSARAGSSGKIQVKGIGKTPLLGTRQNFDHGHGGASLEEAIREAVWGEVLSHELPHGANRVLAVISTGTTTVWPDGGIDPRALIVRVDPLRPAHFMPASGGEGKLSSSDVLRTTNAAKFLARDLPQPPNEEADTDALRIELGLKEMARRIARQYAAAEARGLYHGATSPSNIELDGKFLDFGTQTAQPGYAGIRVLNHIQTFGRMSDVISDIIEFLATTVKTGYLSRGLRRAIPSNDELSKIFRTAHDEALRLELLLLSGAPPEIVNSELLLEPKVRKFASQLEQIFHLSAANWVNVDKKMPDMTRDMNLHDILIKLATIRNSAELAQAFVLGQNLVFTRGELIAGYNGFIEVLKAKAAEHSISSENLESYVRFAALRRNQLTPGLYRDRMRANDVRLIERFQVSRDPKEIQNTIEALITEGDRTPEFVGEFRLARETHRDPHHLMKTFLVFDLKAGTHSVLVRVPVTGDHVEIFGNSLPLEEARKSVARFSTNTWGNYREVEVQDRGTVLEYELPLSDGERELEYALRSQDGKTWWRPEGNARVSFLSETALFEKCEKLLR